MPTLRLLLNIGEPDARRLGLDPRDAKAGETVDVTDEAAEAMLKRGWAAKAEGDDEGDRPRGAIRHDADAAAGFTGDNLDSTESGRADIRATPADSAKLVKGSEAKAEASKAEATRADATDADTATDSAPGDPTSPAPATAAASTAPDFDAMTKSELLDYANAHKVPGTPPSASKDQLLDAVKRHAGAKGR